MLAPSPYIMVETGKAGELAACVRDLVRLTRYDDDAVRMLRVLLTAQAGGDRARLAEAWPCPVGR